MKNHDPAFILISRNKSAGKLRRKLIQKLNSSKKQNRPDQLSGTRFAAEREAQ